MPSWSERGAWVLAISLCAAAALLYVWIAAGAIAPVYWEDEAGYLLNAQVMSGFGNVPNLQGQAYYPGYSFALVPLWWIFHDPQTVYRAAAFVGAAFGLATIVPLTLIGQRFSLSLPRALSAAALISLGPGRLLMTNWVTSEQALTFTFALCVLLAIRYAAEPSVRNATLLGAVAGATFVVHGRAVPVLIATLLWLIYRAVRFERSSAFGIASLVAVSVSGYLVYLSIGSRIFPGTAREQEAVGNLLSSDPIAVALSGLGQSWYRVVVSLGLFAIGLAALGVVVAREWQRRQPSTATWFALALVGVAAISFTYLSEFVWPVSNRLDAYVYGRYLAPFVTLVSFAGLIALLRKPSRRFMLISMGAAVAFLLAGWWILETLVPKPGGSERWTPLNVLGLAAWKWDGQIPLAGPSIVALVAMIMIVVVVLVVKRPLILVPLIAAYFITISVVAQQLTIRPFNEKYYESFSLRLAIDEYVPEHSLSFDLNGVDLVVPGRDTISRNAYQFWLVPNSPSLFDSRQDAPTTELVIARSQWEQGEALGARRLAVDTGFDNALWVMPGELMDELVAEGRLH